jgi:hypothetical protein
MSWLSFNVTIDNAGRVTRNSGDPIANVLEGQALIISGNLYQILTTSSEDFTIEGWSGTTTADAVILPTVGDVVSAARKLTEVSIFANNLYGQLVGLATGTGTKTLTGADGVDHQIKTFPQLKLDTATSFNEFGLGTPNARLSTDLNLENVGSTVRFTTATANTPTNFGTCYVGGYNNTNTTQLVVSTSQRQAFFRNKTNGTWNTWQELFHTENTNFNVFGGVAQGDILASGEAVSTTEARFYLPINSKTTPQSITVNSTFDIAHGSSIEVVAVTPTLMSLSGGKIAVLKVETSGLTEDDQYNLRARFADSKITVNF